MTLSGQHILVTRPPHQAAAFSGLLKAAGARTSEFPLLFTGPPASWEPFDRAFRELSSFDWVLFASVNAVTGTINRLAQTGGVLSGPKIAVVGTATGEALAEFGLAADFCPAEFNAEGLVAGFPGAPELSGVRVLWPRTNIGRMYIADELRSMGAAVEIVHAYSSHEPEDWAGAAAGFDALFGSDPPSVITLTSAKTVENLAMLLKHVRKADISGVVLAVLGEPAARTAREYFGRVEVIASPSTTEGLVTALEAYFAR